MTESLIFLGLWIAALYLGYKFTHININQLEKYPDVYFKDE
ncbi:hypothetical protein [Campylobacter sp. 19-13652]|nr:hypothetical protein [Campylobacter sp. 19-13652]BCX80265.1 hypothetical protein LBC_17270 [Campylobacter sp. 19-13652]